MRGRVPGGGAKTWGEEEEEEKESGLGRGWNYPAQNRTLLHRLRWSPAHSFIHTYSHSFIPPNRHTLLMCCTEVSRGDTVLQWILCAHSYMYA